MKDIERIIFYSKNIRYKKGHCSCCGKKKRLLESFEELDTNVKVCVECSKKLYKYQDAVREGNKDEADKLLKKVSNAKNTEEFKKWLEEFKKRFVKKEDSANG